MKIQITNFVGESYELASLPHLVDEGKPTYHLYVISTNSSSENKTLELYNSQLDMTSKVYIEFLNAKLPSQICNFCSKYGSLISPKNFSSHFSDIHTLYGLTDYLNYATDFLYNKPSDVILYEHFVYYRITLEYLFTLSTLIKAKSYTPKTLNQILTQCLLFTTNPFFSFIFPLEYSLDFDPYKNFEYYPYMFAFNTLWFEKYKNSLITPSYNDKRNQLLTMILEYHKDTRNRKGLKPYKIFLNNCITYYLQNASSHCSIEEFHFPTDYVINHKKDILDLANLIVDDALNFHLQEIYPIISCNTPGSLKLHFPSLIHAIFFYYVYDTNGAFEIKRCANKNCQKLFSCSVNNKRKKYCCSRCAHNVSNRNYQRNSYAKVKQSHISNMEKNPSSKH